MVLAKKDSLRWPLFLVGLLLLGLMASCTDEEKLGVKKGISAKDRPQLSTRNVLTLISDSGYTKYKVLTPLWNVYGGSPDKNYWDFPEGVYLRQLDNDLKEVSMVAADSACYFPNEKLWKLFGRVEIEQKGKAYFYSDKIFFDDKKKLIFSDAFIHIKTPTQILEGTGFESNMQLTKYRVLKPSGMFPTKQYESTGRAQAAFDNGEADGPAFLQPAPRGMQGAPAPEPSAPGSEPSTPPAPAETPSE